MLLFHSYQESGRGFPLQINSNNYYTIHFSKYKKYKIKIFYLFTFKSIGVRFLIKPRKMFHIQYLLIRQFKYKLWIQVSK